MKMSFIQAERECGENAVKSKSTENNLATIYSKPTMPYDAKFNCNSCIKRCPPAFLLGCHGYIIKVVLEC